MNKQVMPLKMRIIKEKSKASNFSVFSPFYSQDLICNSPFQLLYISLYLVLSLENLDLYQQCILWLLHLPIPITFLLDNELILLGEVRCRSLLGVKGLRQILDWGNLEKANWNFLHQRTHLAPGTWRLPLSEEMSCALPYVAFSTIV